MVFFSSAKKEGKVPDKGGHAVGLERYEILCRMEGKVLRVSIRLIFVLLTTLLLSVIMMLSDYAKNDKICIQKLLICFKRSMK